MYIWYNPIPNNKNTISVSSYTVNLTLQWRTENSLPLPIDCFMFLVLSYVDPAIPYNLTQGVVNNATTVPQYIFSNFTSPTTTLPSTSTSGVINLTTTKFSVDIIANYNIHLSIVIVPNTSVSYGFCPNIILTNKSINISPNILALTFT